MIKNIVISILAAVLVVEKVPWYRVCTVEEKVGIFIGISIPLIIFCFFCEEIVEKWRKYRQRVKFVEREVTKLRNEGRKSKGNDKQIRKKSGHATLYLHRS